MLSRIDVPLYLVAIKSFLRFYSNIAVVIHNDGTLNEQCCALLLFHIPGARIIGAQESEDLAARQFGRDSFLFSCRQFDVNYRRLIDTELWSRTGKRMIMDADILVVREPESVIEWIENGKQGFLIGQKPQMPPNETLPAANGRQHVQTIFKAHLDQISTLSGQPPAFEDGTTAGFYGCVSELPLEKIEKVVRACRQLDIPLNHWGSDQCIVIYLLSGAKVPRMNELHYFNFWPEYSKNLADARLIHFLGTNRFYRGFYSKLATNVVRDLQAPARVLKY